MNLDFIQAEFFDIFGILVFAFLLFIGLKIVQKKKLPNWTGIVILLIAISGLIVDGIIVIKTYILN